jgi:hypothetical protein
MIAADRNRRAFEVILCVLRVYAWILNPLYHFKLVSVSVALILAVVFYGLLAVSGLLAWRSTRIESLTGVVVASRTNHIDEC